MNICIRDYLAPSMVLEQSGISMFEYHQGVFIIAALLGFWDFKFTLFVFGPIYLVGNYFFISGMKDLSKYENFNVLSRM